MLKNSPDITEDWQDIDGHVQYLHAVLSGAVHDPDKRDDIVQATLLNAWRFRDSFTGKNGSSIRTWLVAIAHRHVCAMRRNRRRPKAAADVSTDQNFLDNFPDVRLPADVHVIQEEIIERTHELLPQIIKDLMWYGDIQSTAVAYGISVQAFKSQLHRARRDFRQVLADAHIDITPMR